MSLYYHITDVDGSPTATYSHSKNGVHYSTAKMPCYATVAEFKNAQVMYHIGDQNGSPTATFASVKRGRGGNLSYTSTDGNKCYPTYSKMLSAKRQIAYQQRKRKASSTPQKPTQTSTVPPAPKKRKLVINKNVQLTAHSDIVRFKNQWFLCDIGFYRIMNPDEAADTNIANISSKPLELESSSIEWGHKEFEDGGVWKDCGFISNYATPGAIESYHIGSWAYELVWNTKTAGIQTNVGAFNNGQVDASKATNMKRKIRIRTFWQEFVESIIQKKTPEFKTNILMEQSTPNALAIIKKHKLSNARAYVPTRMDKNEIYFNHHKQYLTECGFDTSKVPTLLHGTSMVAVEPIVQHGFQLMGITPQNGSSHGTMAYFDETKNGSWALDRQYSRPDSNGRRAIIVCKVIEGGREDTSGSSTTKVSPGLRSGGSRNKGILTKPYTNIGDVLITDIITFN
jgi:hypothetical protein